MDHQNSIAVSVAMFVALGASFWVIFSGDEKRKKEAPQRLTPLRREKLPRSFETLPTASERFNQD